MIRFAESGGQYHFSNGPGPGVWKSANLPAGNMSPTRNGSAYGYGQASQMSTPILGAGAWPTLIAGVALNFGGSIGAVSTIIQYWDTAGNEQCDLRINGGGQFYFTRNGTTIGATSTVAIAPMTWNYIEFKATFSTTGTGLCEVYLNGAVVLSSPSLTNAQTTGGGSTVTFLVPNVGNAGMMDFYVLDTSTGADTTYLGDVTVAEIYDNGPGVNAAWAVAQAPFVLTAAANASGGSTVYTGTITNGASPTNAWQGFYFTISGFTNAANNGTWLCSASTATSITLLNAAGVAETHAGSCAFQNPLQPGIHGGVVDGYALSNQGTRPPGDNQYISDATAGDKTDFAHQTLSLSGTIAAVVHVTYARKDDAGTRQIQQMCLSGGTEEDSATITLGSNYQYYFDVLETDPHTGAAWTVAGFNAATFGVKEIT